MAKKKQPTPADIPQGKPFSRIEMLTPPDVPTFYSNSANVEVSTFDVRIRLGQIHGVADNVLKVKEIAYVFMSHEHFKAFAEIVASNAAKIDAITAASKRAAAGYTDEKTH